ncbi:MAG: hypothetical protein K9L74_07615 [Candidatus Izimaplasma sp.]|nr:hypothetical protein [Candidatus Izimaplasma bacterium]
MKLLNITMIIAAVLIIFGAYYIADKNNDNEQEQPSGSDITTVYSKDKSVLTVEDDIIYIVEGTMQNDVIDNLGATDFSDQTYIITTSERSKKTLDEIYEYDRLYVMAENGEEDYYMFKYMLEE